VTAEYPVDHPEFNDGTAEHQMQSLIDLITAVRNIRNEANAPLSSPIDMLIQTDNSTLKEIFESNRDYIDRFCHTKELQIGSDIQAPKLSMSAVITDATVFVPLAELVDLKDEQARVQKDVDKFESEVARSERKLANKRFVENAPDAVVDEEKKKQADYQSKLDAAKERLQQISSEM
ncbi:valine--tRNA ligase, partial [Lactobacillus parabuchneri]|nr:valine--tRNA ligase [Lentilactobacillus parabuchneri]